MPAQPKLIVFDLDNTLWPFWVDNFNPIFTKDASGNVVHQQRVMKTFNGVPEMLKHLHEEGYKLGLASRTTQIEGAIQLVNLFGWDKYFQYVEIYPGIKTTHFEKIKNDSGIDYYDMLFFDDEHRNIIDLTKAGVVSYYVESGMNLEELQRGLDIYKIQRS